MKAHNRIEYINNQKIGECIYLAESPNRKKRRMAIFRCKCGKEFRADILHVKNGHTKSCGCFKMSIIIKRSTTHGMSKTSEYKIWKLMKNRCSNPKCCEFHNYGGRGIVICDRWINSFENFIADMGKRPTTNHSIERINNNGNYEPANCKWATKKEQSQNQRTNHRLIFNGESHVIAEWERRLNFPRGTIENRLRIKWSVEKILTTPALRPISCP